MSENSNERQEWFRQIDPFRDVKMFGAMALGGSGPACHFYPYRKQPVYLH